MMRPPHPSDRVRIYAALYLSYALCYFCKRLNYAALIGHGLVTVVDVGLFGSAFELCGGVARILGGVFVDTSSPSRVLTLSLIVVGLSNLCFFLPPTVGGKVALWGVNGFALALAWPALTRIFMAWFPDPKERGTWYSLLSTSMNAGAAVAPHVLGLVGDAFGWRASMWVPGGVVVLYAAVQWAFLLQDGPPSTMTRRAKLTTLEGAAAGDGTSPNDSGASDGVRRLEGSDDGPRNRRGRKRRSGSPSPAPMGGGGTKQGRSGVDRTAGILLTAPPCGDEADTAALRTASCVVVSGGAGAVAVDRHPLLPAPIPATAPAAASVSLSYIVAAVVTSPAQWALGVSYMLNTVVRQGLVDWAGVFVAVSASSTGMKAGGGSVHLAAACVTAYEVGGAAGGFLAGVLSDRLFHGRRGPVMTVASVLLVPLPLCLAALGAGAAPLPLPPSLSLPLLYAAAGMLASAPHVLNGLASREFAAPWAQSSAGGFTKALGQMGGAVAGAPLGRLAAAHGWGPAMAVLSVCAGLSACVSAPLWWREAAAVGQAAACGDTVRYSVPLVVAARVTTRNGRGSLGGMNSAADEDDAVAGRGTSGMGVARGKKRL